MSDIQLPKIDAPLGAKPALGEPEIFAMPEKFRGLAGRVNPPLVKPIAVPQPTRLPVQPIVPPVKPPTSLKKKGLSKTTKILLIAGGVLVLVLLAVGLYVYFSFKSINRVINVPENIPETNQQINIPVNTNTNTNQPTNSVTNSQTNSASPFPNNSQPGRDTDSDGLTDAEELLYRTSSKKPDTDSDGFLDGNEVFHGYDPNAPQPATLSETSTVTLYNIEGIYSINYPTVWLTKVVGEKIGNAIFVIPSGETITLGLEEKSFDVSLADWFSGTSPRANIKLTEGKTKAGYSFLATEDQMTVYIEAGSRVIVLSYQNTVKSSVDYLATFEMMINSLKLVQ